MRFIAFNRKIFIGCWKWIVLFEQHKDNSVTLKNDYQNCGFVRMSIIFRHQAIVPPNNVSSQQSACLVFIGWCIVLDLQLMRLKRRMDIAWYKQMFKLATNPIAVNAIWPRKLNVNKLKVFRAFFPISLMKWSMHSPFLLFYLCFQIRTTASMNFIMPHNTITNIYKP